MVFIIAYDKELDQVIQLLTSVDPMEHKKMLGGVWKDLLILRLDDDSKR